MYNFKKNSINLNAFLCILWLDKSYNFYLYLLVFIIDISYNIYMNYCPLNISSCYSFLSSSLRVDEIFKIAYEYGYPYFATNDLNNMFSYSDIVNLSSNYKVSPIYGSSFLVTLERGLALKVSAYITNDKGYSNLCQIISLFKEGINLQELNKYKEGLVIVIHATSDLNIRQMIDEEKLESISRELHTLTNGFEDAFLGIEIYSEKDKVYAQKIRDFASIHLYKTVAFNLHLYKTKQDAITLKILQAIKNDERLDAKNAEGPYFFLKENTLKSLYSQNELNNTILVANKCRNFELLKKRGKLLSFDIENKKEYIKDICLNKLNSISLNNDAYVNRLNYELDIIEQMGYLDYFLIVKDYVDYAKDNNIPVGPGRGSAAGALVSYLLNITEVDPLKYDLLFERFLNHKRTSMPDIDMDFADYKRDSVCDYIFNKYGKERTANIITFQTFGPKAALRDVTKIFNINAQDSFLLSKAIGQNKTFKDAYKNSATFRDLCKDNYFLEIVKLAKPLEGLPRQQGVHPAGVIINDEELYLSCPMSKGSDGNTIITQFEGPLLEKLGFLKMDILGLTNLTIIEMMESYIKSYYDNKFSLKDVTLDDKKTFDILNRGLTCGIFQLESEGITKALRTVNVDTFNDIVAVLALFRPGPMENIPTYADRKNNGLEVTYIHPLLKEILAPTYGVIVYQEQIMQIVQVIAGFDLAMADIFRRAISKKDQSKLSSLKNDFINGAIKNNVDIQIANNIYDLILKFADYGYNKSHSVSYAIITYQMAYIKANYPLAFYASMMNALSLTDPRMAQLRQELAYFNIKLKLPSITKSRNKFRIENNSLLIPLSMIKGLNRDTLTIIKEIQTQNISTFEDFMKQAHDYSLSEQAIVSLVNAGALDEYGYNRITLRRAIPNFLNYFKNISLEGSLTREELLDFMPVIKIEKEDELLKYDLELQTIGILLSGSLLQKYQSTIDKLNLTTINDIVNSNKKQNPTIIGIISNIKKIQTKKKETMAFVTLKDELASISVTIFAEDYQKCSHLLKTNVPLIVKGYKRYDGSYLQFIAQEISSPEEM